MNGEEGPGEKPPDPKNPRFARKRTVAAVAVRKTGCGMSAGVGASWGAGGARMWALAARSWGSGAQLAATRVPVLRAPDQLLVRVAAAGVSPIDIALMEGYGSQLLGLVRSVESVARLELDSPGEGDGLPLIPGRELIGEVVRAGPGARLRRGARVWAAVPPHAPGAHAQFALLRDAWVAPAPQHAPLSAGGSLYGALSAAAALRAAGLWAAAGAGVGARGGARGRRVLLFGSGSVASAALQLLRYLAAEVTVSCSPSGGERALRRGAACVIDRTQPDYEQALRNAGPWDAALECAGLGLEAAGALCGARARRVVSLTSPLMRAADAAGARGGALAGACAGALAAAGGALSASLRHRPALCLPALFQPCAHTAALITALADSHEWEMDPVTVVEWWRGTEAYAAARGAGVSDPAMRSACKVLIDFTSAPPAGHVAAATP